MKRPLQHCDCKTCCKLTSSKTENTNFPPQPHFFRDICMWCRLNIKTFLPSFAHWCIGQVLAQLYQVLWWTIMLGVLKTLIPLSFYTVLLYSTTVTGGNHKNHFTQVLGNNSLQNRKLLSKCLASARYQSPTFIMPYTTKLCFCGFKIISCNFHHQLCKFSALPRISNNQSEEYLLDRIRSDTTAHLHNTLKFSSRPQSFEFPWSMLYSKF